MEGQQLTRWTEAELGFAGSYSSAWVLPPWGDTREVETVVLNFIHLKIKDTDKMSSQDPEHVSQQLVFLGLWGDRFPSLLSSHYH